MSAIKNWFGKEAHVTDTYIHWSEKNPENLANELRSAYDPIRKAGLEKQLQRLLDAAYYSGQRDEAEGHE